MSLLEGFLQFFQLITREDGPVFVFQLKKKKEINKLVRHFDVNQQRGVQSDQGKVCISVNKLPIKGLSKAYDLGLLTHRKG